MGAESVNAEQDEYWNETAGPKWVALADLIDEQIAPLGLEAIEAAAVVEGARVLDVGCGCGQTTVQLGARVGPTGRVLGVDLSEPMLEVARTRASERALDQVRFERADAQVRSFAGDGFDRVFSRFGVMFFADPPAAFANLRAALAPQGRLVFLCWQALAKNPWMLRPLMAAAPHVDLPPPPEPGSPGPFAFADPDHVRGILEAAGFGDIELVPLEREIVVGGGRGLEETVDFVLQMGPAGVAMREADKATRDKASASVREALEPFAGPDGVRLDAATWIVSARP